MARQGYDYLIKMLLVGSDSVGKQQMLCRFSEELIHALNINGKNSIICYIYYYYYYDDDDDHDSYYLISFFFIVRLILLYFVSNNNNHYYYYINIINKINNKINNKNINNINTNPAL